MCLEKQGFYRGLKALNKLNKKGGFDCPSCAWPDPDDERSGIAEYCENGAKAVAEEATAKKIGADFFAANTVQTLQHYQIMRSEEKAGLPSPCICQRAQHIINPSPGKMHLKKLPLH